LGERDNTITPTPPEEIRKTNRRKKLLKVWSDKTWKAARAEFILAKGGKCEWCGSQDRLTVHHPMRDVYGKSVYVDFVLSDCILLCARCHRALHTGRDICPGSHDDGEIHYKWHDADVCTICYLKMHPEIKEAIERAKVLKRKRQRELRKKKQEQLKKQKEAKKNGVNGI